MTVGSVVGSIALSLLMIVQPNSLCGTLRKERIYRIGTAGGVEFPSTCLKLSTRINW